MSTRALAGAVIAAILAGAVPTGAAADDTSSPAVEVPGTSVDVSSLPRASETPTQAQMRNAEVTARRGRTRTGALATDRLVVEAASTGRPSTRQGSLGTNAVALGFSAFTEDAYVSTPYGPADANAAVVGNRMVIASRTQVNALTLPSLMSSYAWSHPQFFAVPGEEFYWGAAVASSLYKGRFVAVLPSFDSQVDACARGWLNVSVSSSSDPTKPWTRFRIPMTDAYTDLVNIGVSNDKVVITANEWDLSTAADDCIGTAYEGSRIRVVDWADLVDGGTLTVRDVSPTPRTSYYNWIAAAHVPGTTSTSAGATVRLVGDKLGDTWGHLAYATVTGSAKSGTAALTGNVDLTTARSMRLLVGPPDAIAAFPSGNGVQDERPVSVAARGGRLWLTANDSCRVEPDPTFRACARVITLDVTTPVPTVVEDVSFGDMERDQFFPVVGVTRDGTTYLTMSESSAIAHEPIDQHVVYRQPGQAFVGGANTVLISDPSQTLDTLDVWAFLGSVVADATDPNQAYALFPALDGAWFGGRITRLNGDLIGDPGGSFTLGNGSGWTNQQPTMHLAPDAASPVAWVRYSAAPEVEDTPGGPRLVHGRTVPSSARAFANQQDPELGGTWPVSVFDRYVQWQTIDGTWSAPISQSIQLDDTSPTVSAPTAAFSAGTVGKTVPVRIGWTAADSPAGIDSINVSRFQRKPVSDQRIFPLAPSATSLTQAVSVGGTYDWEVRVTDKGGSHTTSPGLRTVIGAYQGTHSSLAYLKTWSTATSTSYLGGSSRYASVAGSRVTFTFTGRAVGFVSTKASTRGKAEVWVDGVKVTTLDLYSSTAKYRQLVWQQSWPSAGTHSVQIRVLGTSGRPRIDADGFVKF